MGGSAIAADLLADAYFPRLKVPFKVCRNYRLPEFVGPDTLLIVISYSGNTEETLAALKEGEKRGARIWALSSGGKLREEAVKKHYPFFLIPGGYQPRAALPLLLGTLQSALSRAGILADAENDLPPAAALLQELRRENCWETPLRSNPAKQLAKKLLGRIPVIIGTSDLTSAVALRFKCQLNENSKQAALPAILPEMNHNEIVNLAALPRSGNPFALVVLRDEKESERMKKRVEITKSILSKTLGGVNELPARGKNPLARLLSLVMFTDFVSVYLALEAGIDPTPVEAIERLKKELVR
jgi:glucose/mannose-6-phosphate isomerase